VSSLAIFFATKHWLGEITNSIDWRVISAVMMSKVITAANLPMIEPAGRFPVLDFGFPALDFEIPVLEFFISSTGFRNGDLKGG
jgi:hypothetical protein